MEENQRSRKVKLTLTKKSKYLGTILDEKNWCGKHMQRTRQRKGWRSCGLAMHSLAEPEVWHPGWPCDSINMWSNICSSDMMKKNKSCFNGANSVNHNHRRHGGTTEKSSKFDKGTEVKSQKMEQRSKFPPNSSLRLTSHGAQSMWRLEAIRTF